MAGKQSPVDRRRAISAEVLEEDPVAAGERLDWTLVDAEAAGGPAPIRPADEAKARIPQISEPLAETIGSSGLLWATCCCRVSWSTRLPR